LRYITVLSPERQRPVGKTRPRCGDNIKMDVNGIGSEDVGWIRLALDRDNFQALVNTVMNLRVL
jgi:hypothetical protein